MSSDREIEQAIKAIALHVKNELGRLEAGMPAVAEKLSALEKTQNETKAALQELGGLKKQVEYIKASSSPERLGKLEGYVKGEITRLSQELESSKRHDYPRMQQSAEELAKRFQEIESDFSGKISRLHAMEEQIKARMDQMDADISGKVGKFYAHISDTESRKQQFDAELSKKLGDIDSRLAQKVQEMDSSLEQRVKRIEATDVAAIHKRLDAFEERSRNLLNNERRMETLEDEVKKLEEIRQLLQDESAFRASMEKKLRDMETRQRERPAVPETEISAIVARRLEEFARVLDRKFPELVTRDEFAKFAADVDGRIRYIEAPDTAAIEKRIDSVERKLDSLVSVLKDLLDRMPVVVE